MKPCFCLWFEWTAFCLFTWVCCCCCFLRKWHSALSSPGISIVCTAFKMSIPVPVRRSGCHLPSERATLLDIGPMCIDCFVAEDTLTATFPLFKTSWSWVPKGFFWRSSFSSYLSCWHMDESEHLGSSDTEGPFLSFPTQAQMHKLVPSAETPRDCAIRFVE